MVLLALGFALIAIFGRFLGKDFTPLQQLYLATGVGFALSILIFPKKITPSKLRNIPQKDWLIMAFRVLIGYVVAGSLFRASLVLTKIGNVAFIQSIPFTAILGVILFGELLTLSKVLYLLSAFIGVVLISINDYATLLSFGRGELYSLISALLFSLSYVSRKWQTNYLNDYEIAQILLGLGGVVLFLSSLILGENIPPLSAWTSVVITGVTITGFLNAINLIFINYGFKRVDNVTASNLLTLEGIFALALAYILFHEFPNPKELLGGFFVILGVIGMNRAAKSSS